MYDERLTVPWWWWPIAAAVGVLLAAELHLGYPGPRGWLPYLIVPPLTLGALWSLGRSRVRLADGVLSVRGTELPVSSIGAVRLLADRQLRLTMGRSSDPAAFVMVRPWLRTGVRIAVADPDSRTPYWLIGTRRPEELIDALEDARADAGAK